MTLVVAWVGTPLVLGLLSIGCGLLVASAAGDKLPPALLLPVGFAAVVVIGVVTTVFDATARLTTPIVIALAVAGLGAAWPWSLRRRDGWAAAAGAGAYLAFGAPVILSGHATFAGYISLDDTSTWLGMADRLLTHGRNLTGLAPSTYQAALDWYWNQNGYPVGAFPPLGIVHQLTGTDSAWLVQPYISFAAGLLAVALYGLLARLVTSRPLRALAAGVAAQPALLYGYALWGGIKEVPAAAFVVVVAALVPPAFARDVRLLRLLPLAVSSAALVAILNFGGIVWIAPLLLPVLIVGLRVRGWAFARLATGFAALAIVLSAPAIISASGFLKDTSSLLTKETELGNLIHPLSVLQLFGIWPVGDFRLRPGNIHLTYVLIAVEIGAAALGLAWAARRWAWEVALYVCGTIAGCALAVAVGSPWIDAKALAIASPAVVVAGMVGVAWLFQGGRRVEAAVVVAAIAGGVLWSNALAYHDVWLAPRGQLRELEHIGKQFSGDGPTLITEYQSFGTRHFLDTMDPEAPAELRRREIPMLNGSLVQKGQYADLDQLRLDGVLVYRTLVVPHTPSASRPPSTYQLAWSGSFYDVWQQRSDGRILEHLPLGAGDQAAGVPACSDVLRLAGLATRRGGRLAAVIRPAAVVAQLSRASYPPSWQSFSGSPDVVYPSRSGVLTLQVSVARGGLYGLWLGGSFRRKLQVTVDGRQLYNGRDQLNHEGIDTRLGAVKLERGSHAVVLRYTPANLLPGSGGRPMPLGPLLVSRDTDELPVTYVEPSGARFLCGKSLDWVEAVQR
jgi:hypothetical protein